MTLNGSWPRLASFTGALLVAWIAMPSVSAGADQLAAVPTRPPVLSRASTPLAFELNQGQLGAGIRFASAGVDHALLLTDSGAFLRTPAVQHPAPLTRDPVAQSGSNFPKAATPTYLKLALVGANQHPQITGGERLAGVANYYVGRDPRQWHVGVPTFGQVIYHRVYPGINLVFHGGDGLEYDFQVGAGVDPSVIQMAFPGARLAIDRSGDLLISVGHSVLTQRRPVVYQGSSTIPTTYIALGGNRAGFRVGSYDRSRPLIVDPVIVYSTFLGGSGDETSYDVGVDASGAAVVAGVTNSNDLPGAGIPRGLNHYQAFVMKLTPAGNALAYATYLGGSADDEALGIAVDPHGAVYVTGTATSSDFPILNAFQATFAGTADAFITKLTPAGALSYSSYLGGAGGQLGYGVAVDSAGSAYVTGLTTSSDFPTVRPIQNLMKGAADAFVSKLSPSGSSLLYSTYLGGSGGDAGARIAVDSAGGAFVTGVTYSADFPLTAAAQSTLHGTSDAFVARLAPSGQSLVYSTYLGGGGDDSGLGIAVDRGDQAYVTGGTQSADFPVRSPYRATSAGSSDAFLARFSPTGVLSYSTYFGGAGLDVGRAVSVDQYGQAYVAGYTTSTNLPLANTYQGANGGGLDGFVAKFAPDGSLAMSTYFGSAGDEGFLGLAVDGSGFIYATGFTNTVGLAVVNPIQATLSGHTDGFLVKFPPSFAAEDWGTYMHDNGRSGYNDTQTLLTPATAPSLQQRWSNQAGSTLITTEPAVGQGLVFWGSWDGYERATDLSGHVVWETFLGTISNNVQPCLGGTTGIVGHPTFVDFGPFSVLYTAGGDGSVYALNAMTGAVIWKTNLGTPPAQFLWASPAFYNGSIYQGVASLQECPVVQGRLVKLDAGTGAVQSLLKMVPDGCTGAPVLSSPTFLDDGSLIITGGDEPNSCPSPYSAAVLRVRDSDLTVLDSWQIPAAEQVISDADFGASPMRFTATMNGVTRKLFGLVNKNGTYYAFDPTNLAQGPVWRAIGIGVGGNCPVCGTGAPIAPSSFDGTRIYVGSNQTTINGSTCRGSVRALDPSTGAFLWEKCLANPVVGAVSATKGVLVFGSGPDMMVLNSGDGSSLYTFHDYDPAAKFWAGPTISNGAIYQGTVAGKMYAWGI